MTEGSGVKSTIQGKNIMTGISVDISSIPRDIAHILNPIVSEIEIEETLNSVSQLIEDVGTIASQISGVRLAIPRFYVLCHTISAAIEYERQSLINKSS